MLLYLFTTSLFPFSLRTPMLEPQSLHLDPVVTSDAAVWCGRGKDTAPAPFGHQRSADPVIARILLHLISKLGHECEVCSIATREIIREDE
jgi:hypothetical protein